MEACMNDRTGAGPVEEAASGAQTAGRALGQAGEQAQQAGAQAVSQAKDVAQEAQNRGGALIGEAKDRVTSAVQGEKDNLAGQLDDMAHAVRRSGEQLEGHQDWIAGLVERGADELATLANTLRTNDLRSLMGNLEDLARRQPALFIGASLAAGFALTRVGRIAAADALGADSPHEPEVSHEPK
jgi:hypothetical protein